MTLSRRAALALASALAAAACVGEAPRRTSFAPLRFDFLLKLQLDVAAIEEAPPPPPGPLDADDPVPPTDALFQMARDRLVAGGARGKAVFVIDQAEISGNARDLQGVFAVHLDIVAPDGSRAAFAEARVSRQLNGTDDLRGALYDLTQQMMQDMNVEFEFQVRRSLRSVLQEETAAPRPPPVEEQPLSPAASPSNAAARPAGGSSGSGSITRSRP